MDRQYGYEEELRVYSTALHGKTRWIWPVSADEWRAAARRVLGDGPWGYVEGNAGDESTTRANRSAFNRYALRPRLLRNVEHRDLSTTLFGARLASPILVAPIGAQDIIHPDADGAGAEASAAVDVPYIASTVSAVPMEEIAERMGVGQRWFQLYPGRDPEIIKSFIRRAEASGYSAIVVTVDTTMLGWRTRDLANVYLPFLHGHGIANFLSDPVFRVRLTRPPEDDPGAAVQEFLRVYVNPAFTWEDLSWVKSLTELPVLVKGLTHPADAREAEARGIDGVVVSNHGGRQVDGAIAALDALVEIKAAVGPDFPLILDSGVRCAADVVKAVALGASAVAIGRPYAYALAAGGGAGVEEMLRQWKAELDLEMGLAGCRRLAELGPDAVSRAPSF